MKIKFLQSFIIVFILISCKNNIRKQSTFEEWFFNDSRVVYMLRKNTTINIIKIYDRNMISKNSLVFKKDSIEIKISKKIESSDYNLKQYTVNKDLAFIVMWKNEENKSIWFFLNRGKNNKRWQVLEILEKTKM